MSIKLMSIYQAINARKRKSLTKIPLDQILYTAPIDLDGVFTCYFEAQGGKGFGLHFFNQNQKHLSIGASKFLAENLNIIRASYGNNAIHDFEGTKD